MTRTYLTAVLTAYTSAEQTSVSNIEPTSYKWLITELTDKVANKTGKHWTFNDHPQPQTETNRLKLDKR